MTRIAWGWTLEFLDHPADGLQFKFWSGEGALTLGSDEFRGTNGAIGISPPRETAGEAVRLTATLDATNPAVRLHLRRDLGPLRVKLQYLYHDSEAASPAWTLSGKQFVGRLSAPVLAGAVYTVDVESLVTDMDRGRVRNWSDDMQRSRYPGDLGMGFLNSYAEGLNTKWPNS